MLTFSFYINNNNTTEEFVQNHKCLLKFKLNILRQPVRVVLSRLLGAYSCYHQDLLNKLQYRKLP